MTDTTEKLDDAMIDPVTGEIIDQKDLAERLLAQAKARRSATVIGTGTWIPGSAPSMSLFRSCGKVPISRSGSSSAGNGPRPR